MSYDLCVRPWRGDAAGGELVDYTVAVEKGEVVLNAVHRVQVTQAGDLAVRWNCQAGKCGSCSAEVNGRPKLMCMTRMSARPRGPVTVTPLRTFPVIRDLFERWLCQDVCHVIRDHEDDKPAYSGPRSSSATPSWRCTLWTPSTIVACCVSSTGWVWVTSPCAAPKCARHISRSLTTRSSR